MARKTGSNGEKTARDLRRAATSLFARHGYAAVSMRQIAQAIGVQAGALYLYTPDKQSLLADLMATHMTELLDAWQAEADAGAAPEDRLEQFVRFHIGFHAGRPDEVFIAYMELRNLEPDNLALLQKQRRAYEDVLEDILKSGVAAGRFDIPDTRLATMALIAMLTGVTTWFRSGGRLTLEEIEETYLSMVRGAVGLT
ncbi:TetR/AcrR family transcriptional regulator [Oceanomicrobium pacificus]|uniref:TetR family transcriptional regulator n=1 Tax=Oceanomicrobium pacificus TaxID=2692916 RepID=A0A6B0TLH6_9RHOB|nr:TetR/AcrR family transcriptional regulator [Oceanomicrobium pacificus]MXU65367.1 TetR family transcriptional regulator [Oceanomicrobium pacificus]